MTHNEENAMRELARERDQMARDLALAKSKLEARESSLAECRRQLGEIEKGRKLRAAEEAAANQRHAERARISGAANTKLRERLATARAELRRMRSADRFSADRDEAIRKFGRAVDRATAALDALGVHANDLAEHEKKESPDETTRQAERYMVGTEEAGRRYIVKLSALVGTVADGIERLRTDVCGREQ